jgi:cytochrome c oxidase subunit III
MSTTIHPQLTASADALAGKALSSAVSNVRTSTSAEASHSGIWVGIFAITMSFVAFTSALFVREGSSGDWQHLTLPTILYWNTLALIASSVTLEMARRSIFVGREFRSGAERAGSGWLATTLALGLVFVAGQIAAWNQLANQGLYLATNPNSSFFYVLTAVHAIHVLGGLLAMMWLVRLRLGHLTTMRRRTFESTAIYWHFMGALWIYLLIVLRTKL